MSGDLSQLAPRPRVASSAATCTLRLEAVFLDVSEAQVQEIAAAMIARAHELANMPDYECDVDVSVQCGLPGSIDRPEDSRGASAVGRQAEG